MSKLKAHDLEPVAGNGLPPGACFDRRLKGLSCCEGTHSAQQSVPA
jgi:hypothetical protein